MVDATTPRLNLVKPEVGGSADTWGDKWNENADKIDAAIIKPDEENVWSAPQHFDGGLYDRGERVVRQSDVTTSPTDTTAGRILKVGDFGVGNTISIPQGADLNNYTTPGEYKQNANANADPALNYPVQNAGVLKVAAVSNGCVQEYTTYGQTRRKFLRGLYDETWSSWVEFYHTGNDANLVQASRTISTGAGLTGGGNLSANRTISLASSHIPIGTGQTWQNVTSSRKEGTTYTNTTGRSIAVLISATAGSSGTSLTVGGVNICNIEGDSFSIVFAIVPPGSTYRLDINASLSHWAELR